MVLYGAPVWAEVITLTDALAVLAGGIPIGLYKGKTGPDVLRNNSRKNHVAEMQNHFKMAGSLG